MAVDIFLQLEGIKGESKDAKHPNEIDVLSYSWGMTQSGTAHMGGGAGAGKVNVQDLNFTHYIDKSSPILMLHCCNGKHIKKAKLTVRKAGEKPLEYMTIELEDILVSHVSTGGLARRGPPDRERLAQLRQGENRVSGAIGEWLRRTEDRDEMGYSGRQDRLIRISACAV